jgi:hypothetical protein
MSNLFWQTDKRIEPLKHLFPTGNGKAGGMIGRR